MLETIQQGLELFMQYGLPVLPYAAISFVVYQVMSHFVKPVIASHKGPDGIHHDPVWRNLRRGMVFYPMLMGLLASLLIPSLIWGYCVAAGAASQTLYHVLKLVLKKRGISIPPPDIRSMMLTPEQAKQKAEEE